MLILSVAHRLSTIVNAEKIVVVRDGYTKQRELNRNCWTIAHFTGVCGNNTLQVEIVLTRRSVNNMIDTLKKIVGMLGEKSNNIKKAVLYHLLHSIFAAFDLFAVLYIIINIGTLTGTKIG